MPFKNYKLLEFLQ